MSYRILQNPNFFQLILDKQENNSVIYSFKIQKNKNNSDLIFCQMVNDAKKIITDKKSSEMNEIECFFNKKFKNAEKNLIKIERNYFSCKKI